MASEKFTFRFPGSRVVGVHEKPTQTTPAPPSLSQITTGINGLSLAENSLGTKIVPAKSLQSVVSPERENVKERERERGSGRGREREGGSGKEKEEEREREIAKIGESSGRTRKVTYASYTPAFYALGAIANAIPPAGGRTPSPTRAELPRIISPSEETKQPVRSFALIPDIERLCNEAIEWNYATLMEQRVIRPEDRECIFNVNSDKVLAESEFTALLTTYPNVKHFNGGIILTRDLPILQKVSYEVLTLVLRYHLLKKILEKSLKSFLINPGKVVFITLSKYPLKISILNGEVKFEYDVPWINEHLGAILLLLKGESEKITKLTLYLRYLELQHKIRQLLSEIGFPFPVTVHYLL